MAENSTPNTASEGAYKVLARKYRPNSFEDDFIGHGPMVETLSNAFETNRIAHAFILTGVRGIGKTTTARILARALNYVPPGETNEASRPSIHMPEEGEHCRAIIEGRHIDVIEMDAASRTGIGDIREIIESVRFLPVSARYKVYIIDEVHMLSTAAFNGLLKTLEEPPPHVKFIFATTEIRKVPITVLSRCQRFDLKRIDAETLVAYLQKICGMEGAQVAPAGLSLIARAAEGSVRDALSLLDQAIALGSDAEVLEAQVRDMLGLADRTRVIDLFEMTLGGDVPAALNELREQFNIGADPAVILSDLLEFTHWLTRLKVAAAAAKDTSASESDVARGEEMAAKLPLSTLTRTWQMLLKGLEEVRRAPQPISAAEMVLIRLAYASDLPAPADLVKKLTGSAQTTQSQGGATTSRAPGAPSGATVNHQSSAPPSARSISPSGQTSQAGRTTMAAPNLTPEENPQNLIPTFAALVAKVEQERDLRLLTQLKDHVNIVSFAHGRIDMRVSDKADRDLIQELQSRLKAWTGSPWLISRSNDEGAPTLRSVELQQQADRLAEVKRDPMIAKAMALFPGAEIMSIKDMEEEASLNAVTAMDDEPSED
ncbi:MAG: DNA polymerase III subunit gamma/tau [Alphaproteobacteria bacterium]|nr:MAG: DNA polymerase III subunit gamma/tau [Alphaproteobacteria bacterium]